jgi:hypothetical protein
MQSLLGYEATYHSAEEDFRFLRAFNPARAASAVPRFNIARPLSGLAGPAGAGFDALFLARATRSSSVRARAASGMGIPLAFSPISTNLRTASDFDEQSDCAEHQRSIATASPGAQRKLRRGSRPVAGRPRFFGKTAIDFPIIWSYQN